jgi:hypothetical protein
MTARCHLNTKRSCSMRGDNNRRHQFLQQALFNILKSIGRGTISLHPLVLAFFGSGAHELGNPNPVSARDSERGWSARRRRRCSRTRNVKGTSASTAFWAQTLSRFRPHGLRRRWQQAGIELRAGRPSSAERNSQACQLRQ